MVQLEEDGQVSPVFSRNGAGMIAGETINGLTLPVPVYQSKSDNELYACDANDNNRYKFIGFATSNGTDGNPIRFQGSGIVSGFTGLAEGEKYYVQDAVGTIGTSPGTQEILVGVAISEKQLLIQKSRLFASGDFSGTLVSGSQVITTGFRPSNIKLHVLGIDTGNSTLSFSNAYGDWSNQVMSGVSIHGIDSSGGVTNGFVRVYRDASQHLTFTITSVTDTGFTITWTLAGNMAGIDSVKCLWAAEGN